MDFPSGVCLGFSPALLFWEIGRYARSFHPLFCSANGTASLKHTYFNSPSVGGNDEQFWLSCDTWDDL